MRCCGTDINTFYCPDCGNANSDVAEPLAQLLAHVRTQARSTAMRVKNTRIPPEGDEYREYHIKRHLGYERAADKWARWAKALSGLIAKAKGEQE